MKKISKISKGFTLIELLVVIAIIAILTAVVTSNFTSSKAKARDAKRISDVAQIQLALELFFDKCNQYPVPVTSANLSTPVTTCPSGASAKFSDYLTQIPNPPLSTDTAYFNNYYVDSNTTPTNYVIKYNLETYNSILKDSYTSTLASYYQNTDLLQATTIACPIQTTTSPFVNCVVPK